MKNKIMIVTGTRKGIGNYLAKDYLARGYIVVGCSRGDTSIKHKNYIHYKLDVSNEEKVVSMIKDIKKKFSRIDILINNAGVAFMNHFVLTPAETVKKIFDTNFLGTFLFTREVAKIMVSQDRGRIINFSTVAVPLKLDGESVYASSKSAIEEFTKITAKELGKFHITINCIGITLVLATDFIRSVPSDKIDKILDTLAIKRLAEVKDITNLIDFLIQEESEYITGQVIYLGGAGR